MKKLGFVVLFFMAFAFVVSAQAVTSDNESFTVSASVGKFVDIKELTDLVLGDLSDLVGKTTGSASESGTASIRANTSWTITASAVNLNLIRWDGSDYLTGEDITIPYTFNFDGTNLITAGALVAGGQKSYTGKTGGYVAKTYSVAVNATDLPVNLDAGDYQDVITLTVAAQ